MNDGYITKEENIALNLIDNINEGHLINYDISSIDRILSIYFSHANENIENNQIIVDFLFNCIDKYGKTASVLFSHLDDRFDTINILKRIHTSYENKFDFSFMNLIIFRKSINLIKYNEKMKKENMILKFFALFLFFSTILLAIIFSYNQNIINKKLKSKNNLIYFNQKQPEIEPYKTDICIEDSISNNKNLQEIEDKHTDQQKQHENIKEEENDSISDDKNHQKKEDEQVQKHDNEQQQQKENIEEEEPKKTEENIKNENINTNNININNNVNHKKKKSKRRGFKKIISKSLKIATGEVIIEGIMKAL